MVPDTRVNGAETGKMICSMDMVLKHGLMAPDMRATTKMVKNMERVPTPGVTDPVMSEIGSITK